MSLPAEDEDAEDEDPKAGGNQEAVADSFVVQVETIAWVTSLAGGPLSGSQFFDEPAASGDTVRSVLRRLSARYPRLAEALWDPATGDIGSHLEIIVNETVLGVEFQLDSPLNPGDRILLAGQYIGG